MSLKGVMRPGHIQVRVMDLDETLKHYVEHIGLIEVDRDAEGRVYLKAWDEVDKFSLVLRQTDNPGVDFVGLKVSSASDLEELGEKVEAYGLPVERIAAGDLNGCGERLRFVVPTGHAIELFAEKEQTGTLVGDKNPEPWPQGLKGMQVKRFDHCLLFGDDLDGTVNFFRDVLEFGLTEQLVDENGQMIAAFLGCSMKAHDIAFIRHPEKGKLHHISFLLGSWEEVRRAGDIMGMHDIPIEMGPTRHGITAGTTIYFFDPSGNRNEVFSDGRDYYPDHQTITWTTDLGFKSIDHIGRQPIPTFLEAVT